MRAFPCAQRKIFKHAQRFDVATRKAMVMRNKTLAVVLAVFCLRVAAVSAQQGPVMEAHRFEHVAVVVAGNEFAENAERAADFLAGEAERESLSAIRARELLMFPRGALAEELVPCESETLLLVAGGRRPAAVRRANACLDSYQTQTTQVAPTRAETTAAAETCFHGVRALLESRESADSMLARCDTLFPDVQPSENQPREVVQALTHYRESHPTVWRTLLIPERAHFELLGIRRATPRVPRTPGVTLWACASRSDTPCLAQRVGDTNAISCNDAVISTEGPFLIFRDSTDNERAVVDLIRASNNPASPQTVIASVWVVRAHAEYIDVRAHRGTQVSHALIATNRAGQSYVSATLARVVEALLNAHNLDFRSDSFGTALSAPTATREPSAQMAATPAPQTSPESAVDLTPWRVAALSLSVVGFGVAWSFWIDRFNHGQDSGYRARAFPIGFALGSSAFSVLSAALLTGPRRELSWWSWILAAGGIAAVSVATVEFMADGSCARREGNTCLEVNRSFDHGTMWLAQGVALLALPVTELFHIAFDSSSETNRSTNVSVSPLQGGVWVEAHTRF